MSNINKTHWLQNPNKNYLGHWDLDDTKDMVLTIKSAKWEIVVNPMHEEGHPEHSQSKRVVRFVEKGVKPFICNEINAQSIMVCTGIKYMENSGGEQIALFVGSFKEKGMDAVDCIRVRRSIVPDMLEEIKEALNLKKNLIDKESLARVEEIIENKEIESYEKIKEYLKLC